MRIKNGDKILFIGDSVTDCDRGRPVGEGYFLGNGYVRFIDMMLSASYPDKNFHIINMGNSGDTSLDVIARWKTDVESFSPDVIVCNIGVNDVWRHFDSPSMTEKHVAKEIYYKSISEIARRGRDIAREVILLTPYFIENNVDDPMYIKMKEYASEMKRAAEENGVLCIDLQNAFTDYLKYKHPMSLTWDRI
ncbi:MAG: SGNH/GDSL hydrolase family protein, partial [Clostridia bacterium]|nr:SGNH/GDSL hydrolase family protein [Clostridia bacterium]